jgi:hypothetical protein
MADNNKVLQIVIHLNNIIIVDLIVVQMVREKMIEKDSFLIVIQEFN